MFRFYCLMIALFWAYKVNAQIQTLHNTVAKGTLNITGGIHFINVTANNTSSTNTFTLGVNYCLKHHYSIGLEANTIDLNKINNYNGTYWHSSNLLLGFNLQRNNHLFKTQMGTFKITSILSLGGGGVFSKDQITEEKNTTYSSFNPTGYYISGAFGVRFEFMRRLFFEVKEIGGFFNKNNVNLRNKFQDKMVLNSWYVNTQIKLGIFMFINTLDKCGTCPKW